MDCAKKPSILNWHAAAVAAALLSGCKGEQLPSDRVLANGTPVARVADAPFFSTCKQDGTFYGVTLTGDVWRIDDRGTKKVLITGTKASAPLLMNETHLWIPVPLDGRICGYELAGFRDADSAIRKVTPDITFTVPLVARPNSVSNRFMTGWIKYGLGEAFVIDLQTGTQRNVDRVSSLLAENDRVLFSEMESLRVMQLDDLSREPKVTEWVGGLLAIRPQPVLIKGEWLIVVDEKDGEHRALPRPRSPSFLNVGSGTIWTWVTGTLYHYSMDIGAAECPAPDRGAGLVFLPIDPKTALVFDDAAIESKEPDFIWIAERIRAELKLTKWLIVHGSIYSHGSLVVNGQFYFSTEHGVYCLTIPKVIDQTVELRL